MGKTRDLFKKIRDIKGTVHAKMGTKKDRNGKDLTEQKRLRRGGKNTEKNYTKNIFMTPWTVAHQVPLSIGCSRQEYWSVLPFPSPGDLPDPGIESRFPAL